MTRRGRGTTNELEHPYVVELSIVGELLDVELNGRIMRFHKPRHIRPQHGRRIAIRGGTLYRWCFLDLLTARGFVEQFGGEFCKPSE